MSTGSDPICRTCRTSMERGRTLDHGHGNAQQVQAWAAGEPKWKSFLGMKYTASVSKRDQVEIVTWRCPRCGLLESYAR